MNNEDGHLKITFEGELAFAREFWNQAIIGLPEEEYPPKPDDWLENAEYLRNSWDMIKMEILTDPDPENVKAAKAFLACTYGVYIDLMCSISRLRDKQEDSESRANKSPDMETIESFQFPIEEDERTEIINDSSLPNIEL